MPATNPRISTVVDPELATWLRQRSRQEGRSLSVLVRDILARYYAEEEERFWAKAGEERLANFDPHSALSHSEAWVGHREEAPGEA